MFAIPQERKHNKMKLVILMKICMSKYEFVKYGESDMEKSV